MPDDRDTELADVVAAFREAIVDLAADFQDAWDNLMEEGQYHFDKELGKHLAKHPQLYAELRRTGRQVKKAWDRQFGPILK